MFCCRGEDPEDYVPAVKDGARNEVEKLRGRLSTIMPPLDADWRRDAMVNMGVSGWPTTLLGGFERRQSMSLGSSPMTPFASPFSQQQQQQQQQQQSHHNQQQHAPGSALGWTDSRKLLEAAIAMEQVESPQPAVPQTIPQHGPVAQDWGWAQAAANGLEVEEARLQGRLWKLKLEHYVMEGDGNCQFRAVSFGLYGTQWHHAYVRHQAVEYMKQRQQDFEAFLGEDFGGYVRQMSQPGTWGDELTLRATCEALSVVINIISSDTQHWFVRHIPRSTRAQHEIFMTYIAPLHFNAIRRQNTGTRLRHSFGRQGSQLTRAVSTYQRRYGIPETPQHVMAASMGG